jgi:hypothetical protein
MAGGQRQAPTSPVKSAFFIVFSLASLIGQVIVQPVHCDGKSNTLIGDADGIYHPALFSDHVLLGLKGTMSETPQFPHTLAGEARLHANHAACSHMF